RKMGGCLCRKGINRIQDINPSILRRYRSALHHHVPSEAGAVRVMERFLEARGLLDSLPCNLSSPAALQLAEYSEYLSGVRGLAPGTIHEQLRTASQFLIHIGFNEAPGRLAGISCCDIEGFIRKSSKSVSRATLRIRVTYVRNLLRFLAATGKVAPGLEDQIDTPRVYRQEKLPRALCWKTVQAFLRSIPKTTLKGRRDYTMFFLMATYGLRVSEVVALKLDDINWR